MNSNDADQMRVCGPHTNIHIHLLEKELLGNTSILTIFPFTVTSRFKKMRETHVYKTT